ncbi:hypothetical protein EHW67_02675 [Arenibacter aquaticus]|uniref:Uncharacterized protein n=1 Tax=Arenibacter aquaticus TaxID=2489054 RepID=A0A3S0AQK6_9FLAO|nr:tetratricopeptide repeat protein [Arenibacter aquaticus]RTE55487.1 hypothetical protein EHW67_02675 [Arenibacter aquaticus]
MKLFIAVLSFFGFCLFSHLYGQHNQKMDSLLRVYRSQANDTLKVKTLSNLYNTVLYNDSEAALKYAREEKLLSKKLGHRKGFALALYHLGVYYNNYEKQDSAYYYYSKSLYEYEQLGDLKGQVLVNHGLAILEYEKTNYTKALQILDNNIDIYLQKLNDSSGLALSYDFKGTINTFMGNRNIALQETLKALRIFELLDEPIRKADALNHLATIEFYLENYGQSIKYNQEALDIYIAHNDRYYQAQALNDMGNTYHYMKDYPKAIELLKASLSLSREMKITDLEATALGNLGKNYMEINEFDKAIFHLNQSLEILDGGGNLNKTVEALNDLGAVYTRMEIPAKAIEYFNKAIVLANGILAKENLRIGYYNRSMAYAQLKAYDRAFEDYQKYKQVSDSIYDIAKSKQIEELRMIYETQNKEQQIALKEKEITVLEQKAQISNLQKFLMAVLLLLSLIGLYGLRQKMKRNRLERERVKAELAFKKKELTTHALHLAKKNEVLENLKQKARVLKATEHNNKAYHQLIQTINLDQQDDRNWENFTQYFEAVHKDFASNAARKYPNISRTDLRMMALIRMNLSSKEIANILNISSQGVKKARQRLRKKMDLSRTDSLDHTIMSL